MGYKIEALDIERNLRCDPINCSLDQLEQKISGVTTHTRELLGEIVTDQVAHVRRVEVGVQSDQEIELICHKTSLAPFCGTAVCPLKRVA